jgi:hypothetical protein
MLRLKKAAPVSRNLNIGQIDTAELLLHRVYAFGAAEGSPGESVGQDAAGWERAAWRSRATRLCRSVSTDLTATPRPGSFAASLHQRRIHFRQH